MRKDPITYSAVTGAGAISQLRVRLVHDHCDGTHRFQQIQHSLEVSFRDPLPHAAKILQHHSRNADLSGKAGDQKRLARADRAADHVAHWQNIGAAGAQRRRRVTQFLLGGLMPGDGRKIEAALHKFQQPARFGLDQILLALHQELQRHRLAVLIGVTDQALQLHALEAGSEFR